MDFRDRLISFETHDYDYLGLGEDMVHIKNSFGHYAETICGIDLEDSDYTEYELDKSARVTCPHCISKANDIIANGKLLSQLLKSGVAKKQIQ